MSKPEFAVRLRGDGDSNYIDLVSGNTWGVIGTSSTVKTDVGRFGGKALKFGDYELQIKSASKQILATGDFTISLWMKSSTTRQVPFVIATPGIGSGACLRLLAKDNNLSISNAYISTDAAHSSTRVVSAKTTNDGNWHHIAIVKDTANQIKLYVDGEYQGYTTYGMTTNIIASDVFTIGGHRLESTNTSLLYDGLIDDFCIIDTALWTGNFTPPSGYLSFNSVIYIAGQEAWGIDSNGDFAKLNNNYSTMTDAQKIAMFEATARQMPTITQLKTLTMPIKAVNYQDDNSQPSCVVNAIPEAQTITPKGRIPLLKYSKIRQVTITGGTTGDGVVKIAVTKDNSTYQVYDTVNEEWKTIDIADIGTDGMSLTDVSALTSAEWIAYDCMDSGIGFAYYLEMASTSDTAYTDELTLNVELLGELKSLIKGTDYDYSYVSNDVLQVKLFKNGDFRINYNPGES